MKNACLGEGKRWTDGPESVFAGEPDTRSVDGEEGSKRVFGKLVQNEDFRARM
jgi:hypothetical protein